MKAISVHEMLIAEYSEWKPTTLHHLPHLHRHVITGRGNMFAIEGPGDHVYISGVTRKGVNVGSGSHIPDLHCRVISSDSCNGSLEQGGLLSIAAMEKEEQIGGRSITTDFENDNLMRIKRARCCRRVLF